MPNSFHSSPPPPNPTTTKAMSSSISSSSTAGVVLLFWCFVIGNFHLISVSCTSPVVSPMSGNPSDYPLGYGYPYGYGNQPSQLLPYPQMSSSYVLPQYGSSSGSHYQSYYPSSSYMQYQQQQQQHQQNQLRQTLPQNSAYYGSGSASPYNSRPYGGYGPYSSGYGNNVYGSSGYGSYGGIRTDCTNQYGQMVPSPLVGAGTSGGSQFGTSGRPVSPFAPVGQSVYPQGQTNGGGTSADHSFYKYNPYGGYYRGNYATGNGPLTMA